MEGVHVIGHDAENREVGSDFPHVLRKIRPVLLAAVRSMVVSTVQSGAGHRPIGGLGLSVELPAGRSVANAAFSPDGSFLALQVSFSNNADGGELAMELELASMASGRLMVVPGTWVSSDALVGFGWPASSDSLVAELSFTTKVQLASWRTGASRPAIAVLGSQQRAASLAIGQYAP